MAPTVLNKLYLQIVNSVDKVVPNKLRPIWMSPAGPKTIFFWAPICKWGLVIAGIGDLKRPAEQLSLNQTSVLALTGIIWSRYSVIITPKNYLLLAVNFFVFLTQAYQASRAYKCKYSTEIKRA